MRPLLGPIVVGVGILLLVQGSACAHSPVGPDDGRVPTGTWGGEHVALTVTNAGAHVEFDCASGDIKRPLTVDRNGRFSVDGVLVQEHGPIRRGEEPARYSGQVDGDAMTLDVILIDSNGTVGTFTLTHGGDQHVTKCV